MQPAGIAWAMPALPDSACEADFLVVRLLYMLRFVPDPVILRRNNELAPDGGNPSWLAEGASSNECSVDTRLWLL
jgi:hypothetical protein